MDKIVITDGVTTITMPRTRDLLDIGANEAVPVTMASGRIVKEVRGFRPGYRARWDWVPAGIITQLLGMIRANGFLTVTIPDPVTGTHTGLFEIEYPSLKVFRYKDGVARWHDVVLVMKAQEVV